jgi:hypothetical protein
LANHKWRKLWIIYFILDTKISEESIFRQVYSLFFYKTIPVNLSFYVYIILKELNTIASNHNSFKKIIMMIKHSILTFYLAK